MTDGKPEGPAAVGSSRGIQQTIGTEIEGHGPSDVSSQNAFFYSAPICNESSAGMGLS
jgi:hypothetical protein